MSKLFYGSICHTDYMEMLKSGKFEAKKADNGKVYTNVKVWINDEKDQFGNSASVQLSIKEEFRTEKPNSYIGNLKESEKKESEDAKTEDFGDDDELGF